MQIKTKFFLRLFILSFIPFLVLSLFSVYLFNKGISQVISPGFENSLENSEFLVENSLELYRLRFLNLVDILSKDSLTSDDIKYFDLILFISPTDTISIKPLENAEYNRLFMEEAAYHVGTFPEIISFEGKILVYQQLSLNPASHNSPLLVVGQYLPPEFSEKAAEIISAKTEYSNLKTFVESSGSKIVWILWMSITAIYLSSILYIAQWWANSLIRPINNLSLAAFDIAKGQWGKTVNYSREDELGTLVNSFNYMSSELKSNAERLVQAEIEASWKNTARVIAHGIKNIISPIKIAFHNLKNSSEVTGAEKEIGSINSEITRLEDIAQDFSQFSRSPDLRPVHVNIRKVAEDALTLAGKNFTEVEKQINIPDDLYLETDYEILRSLMVNLLKNSFEAITSDGKVEISASKDGNFIFIKIHDNGIGVPEEFRDKIWKPYYTTKSQGTGLGLPIVLKFAQLLGAHLELVSDKNDTSVTIEFGGIDETENSFG
jgi:nitrogen fixation/metabolism regulation signal transduction histidine kinase